MDIHNIDMVRVHNTTCRKTNIIRPAHIGTLLAKHHKITARGNGFPFKKRYQALSLHSLHPALLNGNASQLQEGRSKISKAYNSIMNPSRLIDPAWPHHRQGHPVGDHIRHAFDPRERHSMVRGYDHQSIL